MFLVYKDTEFTNEYRVVYFTELEDHNKEKEINRAFAGKHFYDGFIRNFKKDQAKEIIQGVIDKLNRGEQVEPDELERELAPYIPESE